MPRVNIQEVAVDAVGPKVLGEAGEDNITRVSDASDDDGIWPQLQDHGQIDDVHRLFVNEAGGLGGIRHHALGGPLEHGSQLVGFWAVRLGDQGWQLFDGLALQEVLTDGGHQVGFAAGGDCRVSGEHAFQQRGSGS